MAKSKRPYPTLILGEEFLRRDSSSFPHPFRQAVKHLYPQSQQLLGSVLQICHPRTPPSRGSRKWSLLAGGGLRAGDLRFVWREATRSLQGRVTYLTSRHCRGPVRGSGSPKRPHEREDRGEGRGLGQTMGREGLALRRR